MEHVATKTSHQASAFTLTPFQAAYAAVCQLEAEIEAINETHAATQEAEFEARKARAIVDPPAALVKTLPEVHFKIGEKDYVSEASQFVYRTRETVEQSKHSAERKAEMLAALEEWEKAQCEEDERSGYAEVKRTADAAETEWSDAYERLLDGVVALASVPTNDPAEVAIKRRLIDKHCEADEDVERVMYALLDAAALPAPSQPESPANLAEVEFTPLPAEDAAAPTKERWREVSARVLFALRISEKFLKMTKAEIAAEVAGWASVETFAATDQLLDWAADLSRACATNIEMTRARLLAGAEAFASGEVDGEEEPSSPGADDGALTAIRRLIEDYEAAGGHLCMEVDPQTDRPIGVCIRIKAPATSATRAIERKLKNPDVADAVLRQLISRYEEGCAGLARGEGLVTGAELNKRWEEARLASQLPDRAASSSIAAE